MINHLPLLRSPYFNGSTTRATVICENISQSRSDINELLAGPLIERIRVARVGGTFWGAWPEPRAGIRRWRMIETLADADRWRTERRNAGAETLIVLAPHLRALAPLIRRSCAQLFVGVVDPWHLFDRIERCEPTPGSELALLAAIAGAATPTEEDGKPAAADTDAAKTAADTNAIDRLLRGMVYRDPFTGALSSPHQAVETLAGWRHAIDRNRGLVAGIGIARWKQPTIGAMLWAGGADLPFYRRPRRAVELAKARGGAIAIWPAKAPVTTAALATAAGVSVATIEDGFIRSRGLGSDCVPPLSVVVDGPHPHYDPTGPSALETLIQSHRFDATLLARARHVIALLIAGGVGKYDVGERTARPRPAVGRVVLVAGQVEGDASWVLGGGEVASNLDLLRRVRAEEPDAWLIFRPHPDVEARHRRGVIVDTEALRHVDEVDRRTSLATLLDVVDAVHVLTSLAGFEALLRGREVVVHGHPFYAGWGVTRDLAPSLARRTRRATVDEIAAAALILYPRYLDPVTGLPCTPELLVARLVAGHGGTPSWLTRLRRLRRRMPRTRHVWH